MKYRYKKQPWPSQFYRVEKSLHGIFWSIESTETSEENCIKHIKYVLRIEKERNQAKDNWIYYEE